MGLEMIKLKDILNEKKSKHGKLVATIKKGNDVYELYNDIRWGGYSTPIIVKNGKEIKQYGVNMYTKPAIKKFEKEFGGKAKLESVNEAIPKFPRINMGFGEAQDYSKMMIKKSEMVFKSTRAGDLGKAKKAVKDMEEIVTQIKRVLGI